MVCPEPLPFFFFFALQIFDRHSLLELIFRWVYRRTMLSPQLIPRLCQYSPHQNGKKMLSKLNEGRLIVAASKEIDTTQIDRKARQESATTKT